MHGTGNDYVYVNGFEEQIENPHEVAIKVSDRHFGIGADGLIIIMPSEVADFRMRMFNADGSEGKMCGNGTRCIGKYVYDNKLTDKKVVTLETLGGIKTLQLQVEADKVVSALVDMGEAILASSLIPVASALPEFINQPLLIANTEYKVTCVSMGNPHAIVYVADVDAIEIEKVGPLFENNALFPERINTEFVRVIDATNIQMRVWERGSGETLACGTGACASVVASVLNGFCAYDTPVRVHLRGGILEITYKKDGRVLMQGPATHVFDGEISL